jgi:hypothetical protein
VRHRLRSAKEDSAGKQNIETLSWLGLQDTEAFKLEFKTEQERTKWKADLVKLTDTESVEKNKKQ